MFSTTYWVTQLKDYHDLKTVSARDCHFHTKNKNAKAHLSYHSLLVICNQDNIINKSNYRPKWIRNRLEHCFYFLLRYKHCIYFIYYNTYVYNNTIIYEEQKFTGGIKV